MRGQAVCSWFFFFFFFSSLCLLLDFMPYNSLSGSKQWVTQQGQSLAKLTSVGFKAEWKKKKQKPPQNPKNIWQQGQHFKCRDTFFLDLCVISCSLKLLLGNGRSHRWSYHSFDLADPFKCQRQRHCKNPAPCKSGTAFGESCWFFWRAGNKAVSSFSLLFFWGTCKHLICVSFMRG